MIRLATRDDLGELVAMIRELAHFERALEEVEIDEAMLGRALFGEEPAAFARLALVDGSFAGMAIYFRSFSTWTGRPGICLEDLYVRPAHRGRGVGRALLAELACLAVAEGCPRLEWSVLDWNAPAIAFYRSIGALPMEEWTRYRLAGLALAAFAASG
ncbi:MAG TPA: GNAT family N-acetyltransferase [Acidimicrobiales bacterium]|nr:GNAT family N-acetyltransferase [Acidimicrobiales bacterium]